ncbi:hypothetical protein C8Q75DRAFT_805115 [Abortiporus biennis]|nr:hypothetical protein C8Q75DRAFT_805115 [Abortiporus biennis]
MRGVLPRELFDMIIDHLADDKLALANCALVSRSWRGRSHMNLFRRISIRGFVPVSEYDKGSQSGEGDEDAAEDMDADVEPRQDQQAEEAQAGIEEVEVDAVDLDDERGDSDAEMGESSEEDSDTDYEDEPLVEDDRFSWDSLEYDLNETLTSQTVSYIRYLQLGYAGERRAVVRLDWYTLLGILELLPNLDLLAFIGVSLLMQGDPNEWPDTRALLPRPALKKLILSNPCSDMFFPYGALQLLAFFSDIESCAISAGDSDQPSYSFAQANLLDMSTIGIQRLVIEYSQPSYILERLSQTRTKDTLKSLRLGTLEDIPEYLERVGILLKAFPITHLLIEPMSIWNHHLPVVGSEPAYTELYSKLILPDSSSQHPNHLSHVTLTFEAIHFMFASRESRSPFGHVFFHLLGIVNNLNLTDFLTLEVYIMPYAQERDVNGWYHLFYEESDGFFESVDWELLQNRLIAMRNRPKFEVIFVLPPPFHPEEPFSKAKSSLVPKIEEKLPLLKDRLVTKVSREESSWFRGKWQGTI